MKKLLYTLLCAIFVPALMNAAPIRLDNIAKPISNLKEIQLKEKSILSKADVKQEILSETLTNQNMEPYRLYSEINNFASTGMLYGASLIHYIPDAGTVIVPVFTRKLFSTDNTDYSRYTIVPFTNDGIVTDTSNAFRIINSTDTLFAWISYCATNPIAGNKDISKFNYLLHTGGVYPKASEYKHVGNSITSYNPLKLVDGMPTVLRKFSSEINPGGGADYELPIDLTFNGFVEENVASHYYLFYKGTRNQTSTAKYGMHFTSLAEINKNDFEYNSSQTNYDKYFKDPEPTGTWSGVALSDHFDGVIYHAVANIFKEETSTPDLRYPSIAKSVDGGYTFSNFEKLPFETLKEFILSVVPPQYALNDLKYNFLAYDDIDFTVYGPDKMSFVVNLVISSAAEDKYLFYSIVEVNKEGSTWKIIPIEDMLTTTFNDQLSQNVQTHYGMNYFDVYKENNGELLGKKYPLVIKSAPRGHEIQIAKTKDGQYLLAKWLENNYDPNNLLENRKNYDASAIKGQMVEYLYESREEGYKSSSTDEFLTTNVFVKYRKIGETDWSKPMNITKVKDNYVLHSYIPRIIPSIEQIPLLYTLPLILQPDMLTDYGKEVYNNVLKADINAQNMLGTVRNIYYGNFSYTPKAGVVETTLINNDITVYPNPAFNEMNINILNATGNANIEIFNVLGEKVMTLSNSSASTKADISSLGNGMYIIKAKEGGKEYSTTFTIAR